MNSEKSKTSDSHKLLLNLLDKTNLKRIHKCVVLPSLSFYYKCKSIKKANKNNKLKILAATWNEEFELLDRSNSVSAIQGYFGYTIKKHEKITDNLSIMIIIIKTKKLITFKTKAGYYCEVLIPETMKWTKYENSEIVPHEEITEIVLAHCNFVNSDYQQDTRGLYTFVPNKSFGQLLDISPKNFIF